MDFCEGKESNLAFYAGEKVKIGYFPISITGAGKLPFENNVNRYTVFTPEAAYYIAETENIVSCARMFIEGRADKRLGKRQYFFHDIEIKQFQINGTFFEATKLKLG